MLPAEGREETLKKKIESLRKIMLKTKFGGNVPIVPVAAAVGADTEGKNHQGIENLISTLIDNVELPVRNLNGPFFYLIDHCFSVKGQGTVVTGTVIQGSVTPGQDIEFPELKTVKKIKSIQMFKKNVDKAIQGDRVGMLINQLESNQVISSKGRVIN